MYTLTEIEQKSAMARRLGLSGAELLEDTEAVQRSCNGIGADWMPGWARDVATAVSPSLVIVADIHDIRYSRGGTEADRAFADEEFLQNGLRIAARFGWYDPRRYIVRRHARRYHDLLQRFGRWAFNYNEEV